MKSNLVEKSNVLNNFKCKPKENMTLNELRFFCMYISKLNPYDPNKREIDISLKEFEEVFNVKLNTTEFRNTLERILTRVMYIYDESTKKHKLINLYSMFEWSDSSSNCVKVAANYDIIPYLWDLKKNYTTYQMKNIAKLSSVSKIRFYEILTQYKKLGVVQFAVEELKALVQSKQKDFHEFNRNVLAPAIEDINEYTDITVTCEKVLKMRKVVALKFFIERKNEKEQVPEQRVEEVQKDARSSVLVRKKEPRTLEDLYAKYFTNEQTEFFKNQISIIMAGYSFSQKESVFNSFIKKYIQQAEKVEIKNPVAYASKIISVTAFSYMERRKPERERSQPSYDVRELEKFAINYEDLKKIGSL